MTTYFKSENRKSKRNYKYYQTLSSQKKVLHTFVEDATSSNFVTLSISEFGLIMIPISNGNACGLNLTHKSY